MGEGLGRDRDEMKSRADMLSRQSFHKRNKARAFCGRGFHLFVHRVRMKRYKKKTEINRKRAGKTHHFP